MVTDRVRDVGKIKKKLVFGGFVCIVGDSLLWQGQYGLLAVNVGAYK